MKVSKLNAPIISLYFSAYGVQGVKTLEARFNEVASEELLARACDELDFHGANFKELKDFKENRFGASES